MFHQLLVGDVLTSLADAGLVMLGKGASLDTSGSSFMLVTASFSEPVLGVG